MSGKIAYSIENMFSVASRNRCMTKLAQIAKPKMNMAPAENEAAVLVPLCRVDDSVCILYAVRLDMGKTNRQLSFPGGKSDLNVNATATALAATEEEIGLSPNKIDIWGPGPPLPGRDNKMMVTPVIGSISNLTAEDLNINHNEVFECFAVPVMTLCDPNNQFHTEFKNGFILPVFAVSRYKIWGLTAFITHAFLHCILDKNAYGNHWMNKKMTI